MTHYIVGIEDKAPLRESFNATFAGAIRSLERQKKISAGSYAVETHESPLECIRSLSFRNKMGLGGDKSLSTIVADYVMVNNRSPVDKDTRPSLYLLHEQSKRDPAVLAQVPLIIVYSGKPAEEIIFDSSFILFTDLANQYPAATPVIGYRGKTGDLQGDVIDLFGIIQSVDLAVKAAGSVDNFRCVNHKTVSNTKYILKNFRF